MRGKIISSPSNSEEGLTSLNEYMSANFEGYTPITLKQCFPNPTMYKIHKLCQNALYGRFGMREMFPKTAIFKQGEVPADFCRKLQDGTFDDLTYVCDEDGNIIFEFTDPHRRTKESNLAIAAFITSYGRALITEAFNIIAEKDPSKLVYGDTDSIYFIHNKNDPLPFNTHPLIYGAFKVEHDDIVEWNAVSPKCYSYRTAHGEVTAHSKGITKSCITDYHTTMFNDHMKTITEMQRKYYTQPYIRSDYSGKITSSNMFCKSITPLNQCTTKRMLIATEGESAFQTRPFRNLEEATHLWQSIKDVRNPIKKSRRCK
jgi:hypothetical protein